MFKVLSWNIRQGGGSRTTKIVKQVSDEKPDVIIFSEFQNNENGVFIRNNLMRVGYIHQGVGAAPKGVNSVLIASKFPFDVIHCPASDPNYPHNVMKAKFEAFDVYGMYLPHKKKHVLFDFLIKDVSENRPCILAGDFNTGKNYIDQKSNSFMYSEYLEKLESMGFIDAFRLINGDVKEYSWYSHQGNGYRYDHTYVHGSLNKLVKSCYYLHEWRESKISDHSPMVLELA